MDTQKSKDYRKAYKLIHRRSYNLPLYDTKDQEIIDWMESHKPCSAYLRKLVCEDMAKRRRIILE